MARWPARRSSASTGRTTPPSWHASWRRSSGGGGIAYEVCSAAIEHAFVELDLSKVVGRADSRHEASIRLMRKLGMCSQGVARCLADRQPDETVDEVIYAISRDDWSRVRSGAR